MTLLGCALILIGVLILIKGRNDTND